MNVFGLFHSFRWLNDFVQSPQCAHSYYDTVVSETSEILYAFFIWIERKRWTTASHTHINDKQRVLSLIGAFFFSVSFSLSRSLFFFRMCFNSPKFECGFYVARNTWCTDRVPLYFFCRYMIDATGDFIQSINFLNFVSTSQIETVVVVFFSNKLVSPVLGS